MTVKSWQVFKTLNKKTRFSSTIESVVLLKWEDSPLLLATAVLGMLPLFKTEKRCANLVQDILVGSIAKSRTGFAHLFVSSSDFSYENHETQKDAQALINQGALLENPEKSLCIFLFLADFYFSYKNDENDAHALCGIPHLRHPLANKKRAKRSASVKKM